MRHSLAQFGEVFRLEGPIEDLLLGAGRTPLVYPLPLSRYLTPTSTDNYGDDVCGAGICGCDGCLIGWQLVAYRVP